MMQRRWPAAAIALMIASASASAAAGTVTVEPQGGRSVRVFVPTKPSTPTPLVVMLHGCTQTAEDFANATQMDAIAEKEGFVVAYPEQSADTIASRCFQWWEPAHQSRDAGEPKELADAALAVAKAHGVDEERVFVGGISAGAAMSVVLGATYPDRFVAIGVIAGVEYKRATTLSAALSVGVNGGPGADAQGDLAFAAMGTHARPVPTFVVHGTSDGVVAPINGDQVRDQWLRTNSRVLGDGAIDPVKSASGTAGYPFTRMVHTNKANGASVIEYYVVDGLGHAWPGGKMGESYSDPRGPDASALMWAFFKGRTRSAPFDVPAVALPVAPGTTADGGAPGDPANPGDPSPSAAGATSPGADSGGGCAVTREHDASPGRGIGALLVIGFALALAARRRRGPRTRSTLRALALVVVTASAFAAMLAVGGCGADDAVAGGAADDAPSGSESGPKGDGAVGVEAGKDSEAPLPDGAAIDASCPKGKVVPSTGETCIGFGKGSPCDTACGLPAYGFVCFNGGPPGFQGCVQASTTGSFGETYCCPDNKCVPQPDQDKECKAAGTPHRYQCPPNGSGGSVAPPAGCADAGGGGSAVERFYCCP